jgi:drug/metabolite transporter (DMT)-like permease
VVLVLPSLPLLFFLSFPKGTCVLTPPDHTQEETAPLKRIAAYAAIYLFWGASFLAIRIVVQALPPFLAAAIRFLLAGLLLLAFALAKRYPRPAGVEWRNLLLLAILMFVGDYALLFWIERRLASGLAAVTAATIPAQIFLLEWLWLRRIRPTPISAIGLLLGLAGVVTLVLPPEILTGHGALDRYALIGFLAATFWASGTVISTRLQLPTVRAVSAGWQMTFGGTALLALSAVAGEFPHIRTTSITPGAWLAMAYLVLFASLIAFSAYVFLLQYEPTGRVASYAYVNPIIALFLGAFLGSESLSFRQYLACAVIIVGVGVTLLGKQTARA